MTINELITPELRDAWRIANRFPKPSPLGVMLNGIRDLLATLLESEFRREHYQFGVCIRAPIRQLEIDGERVTKFGPCNDPRHSFAWPQWQRAAEERLEVK